MTSQECIWLMQGGRSACRIITDPASGALALQQQMQHAGQIAWPTTASRTDMYDGHTPPPQRLKAKQ
jgi:hypothetical protein